MELFGWLKIAGLYKHFQPKLVGGLHVIGTCGGCEFFTPRIDPIKKLFSMGDCSESLDVDADLGLVGKEFGCIHWQKKEVE